jgi:hypothetical protein
MCTFFPKEREIPGSKKAMLMKSMAPEYPL